MTNEVSHRDVPIGKGYVHIGFYLLLSRFSVTGFWDLWQGGLGIEVFLRERDMRIWFLSIAVEDHCRLIGLWIAIYCRGLWLLVLDG